MKIGFFSVVGLKIHKVFFRPAALKNLYFDLFQVLRIFCKLFFVSTRQKRSIYWSICKAFNTVVAKNRKQKTKFELLLVGFAVEIIDELIIRYF